jgi:hypothetical protein
MFMMILVESTSFGTEAVTRSPSGEDVYDGFGSLTGLPVHDSGRSSEEGPADLS